MSKSNSRVVFASVLSALFILGVGVPSEDAHAKRRPAPSPEITSTSPATSNDSFTALSENTTNTLTWFQFVVKPGNTLAQLFDMAGVGAQQVHEIVSMGRSINQALTMLSPGQFLAMKVDKDSVVHELVYRQDPLTTLYIERSDKGELSARTSTRDYERRVRYTSAIINTSLFETLQQAQITEALALDMAGIFGWDIDFALDVRAGDRFAMIFEELYLDGKKVRDGSVLAAEFINQGQSYRAVRFTDADGKTDYYDDAGRSMRKAFLRTPVDFARVSSRFGNRHHPILNKMKKHRGVDYAAPRGTPVKASGDGRLAFRGIKAGYGKTVIIDHGNGYRTLYAHLNSYVQQQNTGNSVRQGEVIGFVGSTGRATGPHLHYEFQVDGVHRNPLTVALPDAAPISERHREAFFAVASPLLGQLQSFTKLDTAYTSL